VRFHFRPLPAAPGGEPTPRPLVDVWLEGIDVAPFAALVDTGALRTRFAAELADVAGIDLDGAATERFAVGGTIVDGRMALATLRLGSGPDAESWEAAVWFCDPWPFAFQLLGLEGFPRHFRVEIAGYHEWLECQAER
jgi:hypothetical protein